jgi:RNA polymerase sigma factor (sigma-70 family)
MNDDMALVREYAAQNSEEAFAALVSRHVNLVHSAALRQVRDPHLAAEITQTVFILLARKAGSLGPKTILPGWLYRTANYVSAAALKIQHRRERRDQEAYMQAMIQEGQTDPTWEQLAPLLDGAMSQLRDKDRDVLVLRFFQNKSFKEVGDLLGVEERAAQKRVARALEKLHTIFAKRGVASTTATLAGAISAHSVQVAPVTLAKTATAVALAKGVTASASTLTLIKGALKIMAWSKVKTAIVAGVAIILAAGTATTLVIQHHQPPTDFPRSSWANAGYADPASSLETHFWALSQGDGQTVLASMSPDLQQAYEEIRQKLGMSWDEFVSRVYASNVSGLAGFRILKSEVVRVPKGWSPGTIKLTDYQNLHPDAGWDDQIRLHLSITGKPDEQEFQMKKIGNEWKVDNEPADWFAPIARQLLQQHPELFAK